MTQWIKCSERMPDKADYERKIIFSKYDGICTGRYSMDYWQLDPIGDHDTGGCVDEITHWAELPEKPND